MVWQFMRSWLNTRTETKEDMCPCKTNHKWWHLEAEACRTKKSISAERRPIFKTSKSTATVFLWRISHLDLLPAPIVDVGFPRAGINYILKANSFLALTNFFIVWLICFYLHTPNVRNLAALLLLPRRKQNHQHLKHEMSGRSNTLWDSIQQLQGENLSTTSTFLMFFSRPCEGESLKTREMEGRQGFQGHRLCGKCGGFYLKLKLHKRHCLPPRWHPPTSFYWPLHPPPSSWPAHPPLSTWRQRSQTCVSWFSNQAPTSCAVCQLKNLEWIKIFNISTEGRFPFPMILLHMTWAGLWQ